MSSEEFSGQLFLYLSGRSGLVINGLPMARKSLCDARPQCQRCKKIGVPVGFTFSVTFFHGLRAGQLNHAHVVVRQKDDFFRAFHERGPLKMTPSKPSDSSPAIDEPVLTGYQ